MTDTLSDLMQNMRQCWRCSHCKWTPAPKTKRFAKICPSMEWGNFHAYSGGGKVITAYALSKDRVPYTDKMIESVFACTMCGGCDVGCKSNNAELIEPLDILFALRAHIASGNKSPPAHLAMLDSLRTNGNPFGKPAAERARWADGLSLKNATSERVEILLHIGCDNAYTPEYWQELRAIVAILAAGKVNFGVLFDTERATGDLAYDLGFQEEARREAVAMSEIIVASGVQHVVTCSAGSFAGFRNIWPRLDVQFPAVKLSHITEYVEELFVAGKLVTTARLEATVTYHDPCKLGRLSEIYVASESKWARVLNNFAIHEPPKQIRFGNEGLYEAPRKLLARIAGLSVVEMERNRESGWCCGAKAGAREAYPEFAKFAAAERIEEAKSTGSSMLVTSSCACERQLFRATKNGTPEVSGLFSLLERASSPCATTRTMGG